MKLNNSLHVVYQTSILENGRTVKTNPAKRNLLLDSGLDSLADRSYWAAFSRCVLGTGTKATKRDSGAITVTISSGTATASAGFFEAGDVGRLLKIDGGQEVYIDGFTSSTVVSVTGAADESASEFTIWYVNETGHENEVVRTATLGTDGGDNSSTWDGSQVEHKRTFIFPVETENRTYREIGWSHTSDAGGNLLGRDVIAGAGDSIQTGQQYKVVVKLFINVAPVAQTAVADVGAGGWDTSGDMILKYMSEAFQGYSAGGVFRTSPGTMEPGNKYLAVKLADFTLPAVPDTSSVGDISAIAMDADDYVLGSLERVYRVTVATGTYNGDAYGLAFCGHYGSTGKRELLQLKFDSPQTKTSDHTLTIVFKQTWGRVLVN